MMGDHSQVGPFGEARSLAAETARERVSWHHSNWSTPGKKYLRHIPGLTQFPHLPVSC